MDSAKSPNRPRTKSMDSAKSPNRPRTRSVCASEDKASSEALEPASVPPKTAEGDPKAGPAGKGTTANPDKAATASSVPPKTESDSDETEDVPVDKQGTAANPGKAEAAPSVSPKKTASDRDKDRSSTDVAVAEGKGQSGVVAVPSDSRAADMVVTGGPTVLLTPRRSPRRSPRRKSFTSASDSKAAVTNSKVGGPSVGGQKLEQPAATRASDVEKVVVEARSPATAKEGAELSSSEVELVGVAVKRSDEEIAREVMALESRRIEKNRALDAENQERARRKAEKARRLPPPSTAKMEAVNKRRRERYRRLVEKRENDATEKRKLLLERESKAAKATRQRADTRRNELPRALAALAKTKRLTHSMKVESLARGDPLVVAENPRTREQSVQITLDHLPRLQSGKWLNQTLIDWYLFFVTSDKPDCLPLGTDFSRRLMADPNLGAGPMSVIDHHRPTDMRGVLRGDDFCALENPRVIVAPVNVEGNHWALVAIFPKDRNIRFYDSLASGPVGSSSSRAIMRQFFEWVMLHEQRRGGTMYGWEPVYVQGLPRQTNSWDCGVHVCDYVQMLASTGTDESKLLCTDEKEADKFRAKMLVYVLETTLLSY